MFAHSKCVSNINLRIDFPDCHGMLVNEVHVLTGASCKDKYENAHEKYSSMTVELVKKKEQINWLV